MILVISMWFEISYLFSHFVKTKNTALFMAMLCLGFVSTDTDFPHIKQG